MPTVRPHELRAPCFGSQFSRAGQRGQESAAVWTSKAAKTRAQGASIIETSSGATASFLRTMQWLLCSRRMWQLHRLNASKAARGVMQVDALRSGRPPYIIRKWAEAVHAASSSCWRPRTRCNRRGKFASSHGHLRDRKVCKKVLSTLYLSSGVVDRREISGTATEILPETS